MRELNFLVGISLLSILVGCAGVGVVASSDPLAKLNDAQELFQKQDRPLPAERLIREALAIYKERDDPHGLGNSHRQYGDFLRSPAVSQWETVYRRDGFQDKSVTFDNRLVKASEYYSNALEYYQRAEEQHRKANRFDSLTNVYFNMAWSYQMLNDREKACSSLDRALEANAENVKRNPTVKQFGSITDAVASAKRQARCG